ncbi:MAG: biotin/lipoyl-binding protein [Alphaproteobacteria bacterium]|nr:biotin/lipoyl-binding protein [Alphaproteobacteria bacterium]
MAELNVESEITGAVWKITTEIGARAEKGDVLMILESMKMEIPVEATQAGTVVRILVSEGETVSEGQPLVRLSD